MRPSLARMRLRIVLRRTANRPRLFVPLMWVRPKKSNVSGFPSPLRLRFSSANRPNSIRPRLIRVKFQPKLSQSLPQIFQEAIRVRLILESRDAVIGISDDHHFAFCPLLAPDVHPEIETVEQVNVSQQR